MDTDDVVMLKVTELLPAGTVTEVGEIWRSGLLELKVMGAPPAGATPERVTVPVLLPPPITTLGDEEIPFNEIDAPIPNPELTPKPPAEALIVTLSVRSTALVVMVNVPEVLPAGMMTDGGIWRSGLPDWSVTVNPPSGAGPLIVTVPVLDPPPVTELGEEVIV